MTTVKAAASIKAFEMDRGDMVSSLRMCVTANGPSDGRCVVPPTATPRKEPIAGYDSP